MLFAARSIKPGKVVVVVAGRFAGKKAIVVKAYDDGTKEREFGHALVAGLEKTPLPVSKAMSKKKILKRSKVKPFLKFVNYQHLMPTRYQANDIILKDVVVPSSAKAADKKKETNKELKKIFKAKCVYDPLFVSTIACCCSARFLMF